MLKKVIVLSLIVFTSTLYAKDQAIDLLELSLDQIFDTEIISASKKAEKAEDAPATTMVITSKEIDERGYNTLLDLLHDLPGFDFVNVHGVWPAQFTQRGLFGDENRRTLFMIDGIVENDLFDGSLRPGPQYSLNGIERVEVIWGPASALYGANALGGVINLITKKANSINSTTINAAFGSTNTTHIKLLTGKELSFGDFTLSGSYYSSQGPTFEQRSENYSNSYTDKTFSIIARANIFKHVTIGTNIFNYITGEGQLYNNGDYHKQTYGYSNKEGTKDGSIVTEFDNENPSKRHFFSATEFIEGYFSPSDKINVNFKVFHRWNEELDSYAHLYSKGLARDNDGKLLNDSNGNEITIGSIDTKYSQRSYTIAAELQTDIALSNKQDIVLGAKYEMSKIAKANLKSFFMRNMPVSDEAKGVTRENPISGESNITNISAFFQYQLKTNLLSSTNFTAGARFDKNSEYDPGFKLGESFNPRAGVVIKPLQELTFKLLGATAFRVPSSSEKYSNDIDRLPGDSLGRTLLPERLKSIEISSIFKPAKTIYFETNMFYNWISDIIVSNVKTSQPIEIGSGESFYGQNQNRGDVEIMGLEFKSKVLLSKELSFFINTTLQRGREENDQYNFPNIAQFKNSAGITYTHKKDTTIYVVNNWIGDRSTHQTNPLSKVDGYSITSAHMVIRNILRQKLSISLKVSNIFDTSYLDPGIRASDGSYRSTTLFQPGRTFYARAILDI